MREYTALKQLDENLATQIKKQRGIDL